MDEKKIIVNVLNISIQYSENHILIKNDSNMELWIFQKAIKPKRKNQDIYVIKPNSFIMIEKYFDLNGIGFYYKDTNHYEDEE